jgi:hypothetical protein
VRNANTEHTLDIHGKEPQNIRDDRRTLQNGQDVKKRQRGGMRRMKARFLWLTEDMLHMRWNHGHEKDKEGSDEKDTLVEVANIGDVSSVVSAGKADKKPFRFRVHLIDDPDRELIFDVDTAEIRDLWVRCIKRLALGELDYQLVWDQRDAGTEISVHWRADDTWFPGVISGFDTLKNEHLLQFDDGKTRLYDLSRVFFRIVQLPDWRRDEEVYEFDAAHVPEVPQATLQRMQKEREAAAAAAAAAVPKPEPKPEPKMMPPGDPPPPTGVAALAGLREQKTATKSSSKQSSTKTAARATSIEAATITAAAAYAALPFVCQMRTPLTNAEQYREAAGEVIVNTTKTTTTTTTTTTTSKTTTGGAAAANDVGGAAAAASAAAAADKSHQAWMKDARANGAAYSLQQLYGAEETGEENLSSRAKAKDVEKGDKIVDSEGTVWDKADFHSVRSKDKGNVLLDTTDPELSRRIRAQRHYLLQGTYSDEWVLFCFFIQNSNG